MAISYQHLKQRPFEPVRQHYGERDTMLYALTVSYTHLTLPTILLV